MKGKQIELEADHPKSCLRGEMALECQESLLDVERLHATGLISELLK